MNYWAGLHNSPDEENIKAGAENLLHLATAAAAASSTTEGRPIRRNLIITDATMANPDGEDMETDNADA
jgi:hypothetical protein